MKTLYLDCAMGAAGDMLTAALLELLPDPDAFLQRLNAVGIPGAVIKKEKSVKCGIVGTHVSVFVHGETEGTETHSHTHDHSHPHAHPHRGMDEIRHIVTEHMILPADVAADVLGVYEMIAAAESRVHGVPVSEIHFHEVGMTDAIADITAVCLLMKELGPDEIVVSPVHVGSGSVKCAHGVLPVPAPATALLLQGIPVYGGSIDGELCTPTGAALLKKFATRFGALPAMTLERVGYGMGTKDFSAANCVRALLGESADQTDTVCELSCNVDDMTGEELAFAAEQLYAGGAREVFTVPIAMKKGRPGTLICVLCLPQDKDAMLRLLYRHTSTIGVRETCMQRYILDRKITAVQTKFGEVHVKESSGYGAKKRKVEYEDLARIAREKDLSLAEVRALLEQDD